MNTEHDDYEFQERAAIMEFDGGLSRDEAERRAREIAKAKVFIERAKAIKRLLEERGVRTGSDQSFVAALDYGLRFFVGSRTHADSRSNLVACFSLGRFRQLTGSFTASTAAMKEAAAFIDRALAIKRLLAERGVRTGSGRQKGDKEKAATVADIAAELGVPERTVTR